MNKNSKKILALGFIGLTALSAGTVAVSAYSGNNFMSKKGIGATENALNAIQTDDYSTFKTITGNENITEEQFEMLIAREDVKESIQKAIDAEDYDLLVDAMIEADRPVFSEEQFQEMIQQQQTHEKIEQAIESGDYNVWLSAVQELPHGEGMADVISEDEFELFIDMHELQEEGNHEEAINIAKELGLDQIMPRHGAMEDKGRMGNKMTNQMRNELPQRTNDGERHQRNQQFSIEE